MHEIIAELSDSAFLRVSGTDAKKLLQGQLTCDLENIQQTIGSYGAHCNPKGRVISFFYLYQQDKDYLLQLPADLLSIAQGALQKYAPFFKAKLSQDQSLTALGYSGHLLNDVIPHLPAKNHHILSHQGMLIKAVDHHQYEIIGNTEAIHELKQNLMRNIPNLKQENSNFWRGLTIARGIATINAKTTAMFLPHELQLIELGAVSFNKGCFTGQEIIARLEYRGKLKTALNLVKVDHALSCGQELFSPKTSAFIVDVVQIGYNQYWALIISQGFELYLDALKTKPLSILETQQIINVNR